jgi:glutamate racemase
MVGGIRGSAVINLGKIWGSQVLNEVKPTGPSVTGLSTPVFGRYAPMFLYAVRSFSTPSNGSVESDKILRIRHQKQSDYATRRATGSSGKIMKFPLGFGDSGAGGLIFMLQASKSLYNNLIEKTAKYNIEFSFVHLGDAHNAPYGPRDAEDIQNKTKHFLTHLAHEEGCQSLTIACNTASTTVDSSMNEWIKETLPGLDIIPILKPTAQHLYNKARLVSNGAGKLETHVGVLSTPATTLSQQFPKLLAKIHAKQYGEDAYTVVVNDDSRLKKWSEENTAPYRVFKGSRHIQPGSHAERRILRRIADNESNHPVQFIHTHAPANWVSIMEGKIEGDLVDEVKIEMKRFLNQASATLMGRISVVGLCCTHYPFIDHVIKESLWEAGLTATETVAQGAVVAETVINPAIDCLIQSGVVAERKTPLFVSGVKPIGMKSLTTADDSNPGDLASFENVQKVSALIDPQMTKQVVFERIRPLHF